MYPAVQNLVQQVAQHLNTRQPDLARLFAKCYPNTLETTTTLLDDDTAFVFTGDIPAMWLRDSSAQVRPYIHLAGDDPDIRRLICGLIRRQALYLSIDSYANAFNKEPNGAGHQADRTTMNDWLWERKYELDSLCYPIQLCKDYWDATHDESLFDPAIHQMFRGVIATMRTEQHHAERSSYSFERDDGHLPTDTLTNSGRGTPIAYTGMVWSGFRPSDDACTYGYLVPANMFAVVVLGHIASFAQHMYHDVALAEDAITLLNEIERGIQQHAIVRHPHYGLIYAYETDGMGNHLCMDDANVPSLLSIPYLGYRPADDPIYRNTRAFILSRDNPYYFVGDYASGIGSPHTPPGYVWHIGLIMQGLTSTDPAEQERIITQLLATHADTGYMHESFDPNDPDQYTRPWFAWANSLCGQLIHQWVFANQHTSNPLRTT